MPNILAVFMSLYTQVLSLLSTRAFYDKASWELGFITVIKFLEVGLSGNLSPAIQQLDEYHPASDTGRLNTFRRE